MTTCRKLTIVIADDEEANLDITLLSLKRYGHIIHAFNEGLPAWNYMKQHPDNIDIAILDNMMYTLTGIEIIRKMKQHTILQTVPIIIQSGLTGKEAIAEAIQTGADHYLEKPYKINELTKIITKLTQHT